MKLGHQPGGHRRLATPRIVDIPPVAGAALLGLDHIGAPPSAQARLRDAYYGCRPAPRIQHIADRRMRRCGPFGSQRASVSL
jgi:hypothetical protein